MCYLAMIGHFQIMNMPTVYVWKNNSNIKINLVYNWQIYANKFYLFFDYPDLYFIGLKTIRPSYNVLPGSICKGCRTSLFSECALSVFEVHEKCHPWLEARRRTIRGHLASQSTLPSTLSPRINSAFWLVTSVCDS